MPDVIRVPKGLNGVAVTETRISKSDADGSLIYRGYEIHDLVEKASFETTAYLVLNDRFPTRSESEEFGRDLVSRLVVPEGIYDIVRELPRSANPMDTLRTSVSALGTIEGSKQGREGQLSLAAKTATLVAGCHRISSGMQPVEPKANLGYAANFLRMILGSMPSEFEASIFEKLLILYMEHDLNASTFAVRVVASTLADFCTAVTAGLAALKGPLHGGANENAMELLLAIGEPARARKHVTDLLARGEKIPGFGHRVYKNADPRAQICKELLRQLLESQHKDDKMSKLAAEVERAVWETKGLPANLDFYAGPIFYSLGIPIKLYTPIFAASRTFGWIAHYDEQVAENKLIRPDSIYVGRTGLKLQQEKGSLQASKHALA